MATSDVEIADPRFPLAVTMLGPSTGFDLSLRDASGASVGTMTAQWGPSRQEDITLNAPAPGHYTVRVRRAPAPATSSSTSRVGSLRRTRRRRD